MKSSKIFKIIILTILITISNSTKAMAYTEKPNTTNNIVSNEQEKINIEKENARKDGYLKGLEDGYINPNKYNDSSNSEYKAGYKVGYEQGYSEGKAKLENECKVEFDKGYKLGIVGKKKNNDNKHPELISAYDNGYAKGILEYCSNEENKYAQQGTEDGSKLLDRKVFVNTQTKLIEAYDKAYEEKYNEVKTGLYKLGYEMAFKGEYNSVKEANNELKESFLKEGYKDGLDKIQKEKENAYKAGKSFEKYLTPPEFLSIEGQLKSEHQRGIKSSLILSLFMIIATFIGFLIFNKFQNKKITGKKHNDIK